MSQFTMKHLTNYNSGTAKTCMETQEELRDYPLSLHAQHIKSLTESESETNDLKAMKFGGVKRQAYHKMNRTD